MVRFETCAFDHHGDTVTEPSTVSVLIADTFGLRLRGLLGRRISPGEGLLLVSCDQIHTWFMAYPIDCVYLDDAGTVIDVDEDVHPWRFCTRRRGAHDVLELPSGSCRAAAVAIGDTLRFQD